MLEFLGISGVLVGENAVLSLASFVFFAVAPGPRVDPK